MNVLVIGNGGREHALGWKISQSTQVERVFVAPGNAGTAADCENVALDLNDFNAIEQFARQNEVNLTVVGPEAPLAAGMVDALQDAGMRVFGPNKNAAQLEASKVFCKKLLRTADIPTADFRVFGDARSATRYVQEHYPSDTDEVPLVVKADGLAAGKGVIVCSKRQEALDAIDQIATQRVFGDAGSQLILEERLEGQEASVLAITDGQTIVTLPPAQDHKPALDGDQGPNTGGMGAYSPTPVVDEKLLSWVEEHVLVPTVHAMKRSRNPFKGVLYAGLMITRHGSKVLEYNVRFGDPECQPLLMRLQSDLVEVLDATVDGRLDQLQPLQWDPRPAVCVVMASDGYPGSYETGHPIRGLDAADQLPDVKVFHAGTRLDGEQAVTAGGRVLGVTAVGETINLAKQQAYEAVKSIDWPGAWCRSDISDKALTQQAAPE